MQQINGQSENNENEMMAIRSIDLYTHLMLFFARIYEIYSIS